MAHKLWSYFIFLAWISYLMTSALFLFINGFFLTRVSRPEQSTCTSCQDWQSCDGEIVLNDLYESADICLEPRGRVVLLVIDALKYDFLEWQDDLKEPSYQRNKLPIVNELLKKYPSNARLYKSIADPPTTTMQRIKALTTGTLPTFIDIGSNFASEAITEDNLIDQNIKNGVVFMGDDTWTNLYPGKFLRQFPSPSFNVWDLDTVDNEVRNRIFFELQKKDWSLLIAHTLGVDHCGHKHGQNHPEMTRKLNETNELIREVTEVLDDDTVLFVIGDHGMTDSGDHGGDSPNEVEAGMFVYSKKPLQDEINRPRPRTLNQVDIVPTFSAILGSPIPFSNIGSVIVDALPKFRNKTTISDHPWYTVHSIWRSVKQARKYVDAYSFDSFLFTEEKLERLNTMYNHVEEEKLHLDEQSGIDKFLNNAEAYLKLLRDSCIEIWAQFESNLMSKGLLLMFCTLFFTYLFINGVPEDRINQIFDSSVLWVTVSTNCVIALIIYCLYATDVIEEFVNITFFTNGVVSLLFLVILVIQNWDVISSTWYDNTKSNKKLNYFIRVILLLLICGLFSNSYVVEEDKVLSFLLVTLVWLLIYSVGDDLPETVEKKHKTGKPASPYRQKIMLLTLGFVICIAIRISTYFWRCREEQVRDSCALFGKIGSITSNSFERVLLIITLFVLALYVTIVRTWLRNCGNLTGFSPSVILARYCPWLMVVCIGAYWVLQRLPKDGKVKFTLLWQMNAFPGVVYFCVILAIIVLFIRPLKVFLLPKQRESFSIYQGENIVPKLFDKVKELFYAKKENNDTDIPVVYGLGTVYSAAFISMTVFLSLLYALLLGNVLAPCIFMMTVTGACVLAIVAMERYRNANDINELLQIPSLAIFCWFMIAEYFFYGTGHQSTFPTIYWDAAFVGTGGVYYGNFIPAVLIGINTFGSHIILAAALPLLVIAPFTIFVMIPRLAKVKFRVDDDMKRGELVLFDKGSTFHNAVFSVCIKYMLFHGFRTFGCMFAATVHCRHLMVWKIFAPKLIFEGISFLVSLVSVLASYFLVIRIDQQVEKLITRVTKTR